jgi:ribosome assembly protein YihI (activator of Der GTPase)
VNDEIEQQKEVRLRVKLMVPVTVTVAENVLRHMSFEDFASIRMDAIKTIDRLWDNDDLDDLQYSVEVFDTGEILQPQQYPWVPDPSE